MAVIVDQCCIICGASDELNDLPSWHCHFAPGRFWCQQCADEDKDLTSEPSEPPSPASYCLICRAEDELNDLPLWHTDWMPGARWCQRCKDERRELSRNVPSLPPPPDFSRHIPPEWANLPHCSSCLSSFVGPLEPLPDSFLTREEGQLWCRFCRRADLEPEGMEACYRVEEATPNELPCFFCKAATWEDCGEDLPAEHMSAAPGRRWCNSCCRENRQE